jgi:hypothetical protein
MVSRCTFESAILLRILVKRFNGSFNKASAGFIQRTQFVLNYIPYNWQIDTEILMNEDVA